MSTAAAPPLSGYAKRRAMAGAVAHQDAAQVAYEAGQTGASYRDAVPDIFRADRTVRQAYNSGRQETAAGVATRVAKRAAGHVRSAAGSVAGAGARRQGAQALTGGQASAVGVGVAVLAVIALYLLLSRSGLAVTVVNGVVKSLAWLVSPQKIPF